MKMISEQQTYSRLRLAPANFAQLSDEEALAYVAQVQAERSEVKTKKPKEPKDPTAPKPKRGKPVTGFDPTKLG